MRFCLLLIAFLSIVLGGCNTSVRESGAEILFQRGAYPYVTEHGGHYYYMMQAEHGDSLTIYASDDLLNLSKGEKKTVLTSIECRMHNFHSPELHYIKGKWYLYFEADDGGNTDNHQLYVLENESENPMTGDWTLHDPIKTNEDWNFGLHPSTFVVKGRQYLVWSGWPKRRIEDETQCIFIAEMENPWTLKSERVVISTPEYEWERQWINPDGTRLAYPVFVNENPEPMLSPDGQNIVIAYSASGIWTVFNRLGILYAPIGSDFLQPTSWSKLPEPQFVAEDNSELYGTSNISVIQSSDKASYKVLYQAKRKDAAGAEVLDIRIKDMQWNEKGLPEFGKP